jgi:hypothetical protein
MRGAAGPEPGVVGDEETLRSSGGWRVKGSMPALAIPPGDPGKHPDALALHRYHLGQLEPEPADAIARHLAGCDRCQNDLGALEGDHRRFEREVFPLTRDAVEARGTRRWRWPHLVPLVGALAAAAFLLVLPRPAPEPDLRAKGGGAMAVFVARGDAVVSVEDGKTPLRAGDRIRFVLWPSGQRYAVIGSIDGAGRATVYFPFEGKESAPLPDGPRVEVPGSIVLDDSPGPERVFAILSGRPVATATVTEALRTLGRRGGVVVRKTTALAIPGTASQTILLEKTP